MRALSSFFVILVLVTSLSMRWNRHRSYSRPLPQADVPSQYHASGKPLLWEGPDGKVHIIDPKDSSSIDDALSSAVARSTRGYGSREPEVNFEPGQPMIDASGHAPRPYSSRYR